MPSRSVLFVCLTAFLLSSGPAAACSCGRIPSLQEALDGAESVFVGRVAETWPVTAHIMDMDTIVRRVTLRISTTWKGDPGPEIVLIDLLGSCSYPFRRGEKYLVFTYRLPEGAGRSTSGCTLTQPWSSGALEAAALGPGRSVAQDAVASPESFIHKAGRRLKAAFLGAHFLIVPMWSKLADTSRGVFLRFGIELAVCTVLAAIALLVRRGRWKRFVFGLAVVALTVGLVVLGIGYREMAANPWLKPVIE